MIKWFSQLTPRVQGLVTIAWTSLLAIAAYVLTHEVAADGRFYPILFPICGLAAAAGVFQLVTGYERAAIKESRIPKFAQRLMLVAVLAGIVAGIVANKWVFGVYW
jgi:hypothetical protein